MLMLLTESTFASAAGSVKKIMARAQLIPPRICECRRHCLRSSGCRSAYCDRRHPPSTPPQKADPPPVPPSLVARIVPPLGDPPSKFKKFHREAMSHELGLPKRREFRLELAESRRNRAGMDRHPDTWTADGVKGGDPVLPRDRVEAVEAGRTPPS
jgi:hypothetical protein